MMTHLFANVVIPFAQRSLAERLTLVVHISAGAVGIILGFVALFAAKGAPLHRKVGIVFVYAMLTMGLLGAMGAAVWDRSPFANVPVGLLTAYLVVTALRTVRATRDGSGLVDLSLMLVPIGVCVTLLTFGAQALASPNGAFHGFPTAPFFIFALFGLLAAVGDWRMIRSGGVQALRGAPRLARHLWRMCLALLIAAFSFFLGQAKVIPKPIRIVPLLMIPPLVVLAALLYWLWRVRIRKSVRGIVEVTAPDGLRGTRVRPLEPSPSALT